ncbi:23S rRNA (uracil(1939)-C(5))-methyltransferase RlmD [Marinobacterium sp. AK62]|uniref:23S rRNA (uracil(1939)-C(5))-methyltransferase RlmD n=1 Tax=Marinobacterium alkalitolerans TaxID=1542925 RepID=A0ABS3ZA87_9GAMM|nr:23S rRNA (uracil(1939)-C(5))-methyltransferase RlmD [Marinobacterium alkalitolerans]MBP0048618.1 23S rRNA (uracil(1939)-C(5))-methyltransferase RlmD [Marinobacterium alkalitolerans]
MRKTRIRFGGPARRQKTSQGADSQHSVLIDRLSHEGRGVGLIDGKTTFIPDALPGEQVDVRLEEVHKRYNTARVITRHNDSTDRVPPLCAHYGECGGCDLQHLNVDAQRQHKEQQVLDQLKRFADTQPDKVYPPIIGESAGYRRAARIGINQRQRDGQVLIGFRRRGSKKLLDIDTCPVMQPELQPVFRLMREALKGQADIRRLTHIDISRGDSGGYLRLRCTRRPDETLIKRLEQVADQLGLQLEIAAEQGQTGDPSAIYTLPEQSLALRFASTDFIQVNGDINRKMVNQALAWLAPGPEDRVLDLFSGLGNFTLPLAQLARQAVGVEGSEAMVARARDNAATAGLKNAQFYRADLSESFVHAPWFREGFDLILLDPPRTGARETVHQLARYGAKRILYISCNPSALVADLSPLLERGYHISKFGIMDMFPQTAHVESMLLLERANA